MSKHIEEPYKLYAVYQKYRAKFLSVHTEKERAQHYFDSILALEDLCRFIELSPDIPTRLK